MMVGSVQILMMLSIPEVDTTLSLLVVTQVIGGASLDLGRDLLYINALQHRPSLI